MSRASHAVSAVLACIVAGLSGCAADGPTTPRVVTLYDAPPAAFSALLGDEDARLTGENFLVGWRVPNIDLDPRQGPASFYDLRGKVVLLLDVPLTCRCSDFSPWFEDLNALAQRFPMRDFEIVVTTRPGAVPPVPVWFGVSPVTRFAHQGGGVVMDRSGVTYFLFYAVVDRNGVIVYWDRVALYRDVRLAQLRPLPAMESAIAELIERSRAQAAWPQPDGAVDQYRLGIAYRDGAGVPQDNANAVYWVRKAADQGYAPAQAELGIAVLTGRGVPQDVVQAAASFHKAAAQGDAVGAFNLGPACANGRGVTRNDAEAMAWYQRAAEQGHPAAQNNLGVMYRDGRGARQDYGRATYWFRNAAEGGNALAQWSLGSLYASGRGAPANPSLGYMWVSLAQQSLTGDNQRSAASRRDAIARQLSRDELAAADVRARECRQSAFKGCELGQPR